MANLPRKVAVIIGFLGAGLGVTISGGAEQPNQVRDFMRMKLPHAQKVIEGLALEDFELIARHAQELSLISQASNWQVVQTQEYLDLSAEFRRATNRLKEAAEKKNLDRATLAYLDITLSCVNCHKYLRDTRLPGK